MNYQKQYAELIEDIRYKLSKLNLNRDQIEKYLASMDKIDNQIQENDEFYYYEAVLSLLKLETKLTRLIQRKNNLILPPYENKAYLKSVLLNLKQKMKNLNKLNNRIKLSIISYLLTSTMLFSAGGFLVNYEKNREPDKLYLTETRTYNSETTRTKETDEYKNLNEHTTTTIKKVMPWVREEKGYSRKEYVYQINNLSYSQIIALNDYESIIANLRCTENTIYKDDNEMYHINKYQDTYFEVTEITQNQDKYILHKSIVSTETILGFFALLLGYILVYKVNNGTLIDSLISAFVNVNITNKLNDSYETTYKLLQKQYNSLKKQQ